MFSLSLFTYWAALKHTYSWLLRVSWSWEEAQQRRDLCGWLGMMVWDSEGIGHSCLHQICAGELRYYGHSTKAWLPAVLLGCPALAEHGATSGSQPEKVGESFPLPFSCRSDLGFWREHLSSILSEQLDLGPSQSLLWSIMKGLNGGAYHYQKANYSSRRKTVRAGS